MIYLHIAPFFLAAGLASLTGLVLYLWFFAMVYFACGKAETAIASRPKSRFVFVVPAHNEEAGISTTVQSLLSVCYPPDLFDVVVVADNCTDLTVEKARAAGAQCLERHDKALRGKGYALRHAFAELMPRGYDCFVVIDADSIVSSNYLAVLDARLMQGEQVIQTYNGISNPDASVLTYLFQVGNLIENKLYWQPKHRVGLPVLLRGNGMCFGREVLEKYPWNAFSIVEDTEYGLMLLNNGISISFAADTGVYACQPESLQQAFAQRVRWASGNSTLTRGRAIKLIASGVMRRSLPSVDLGISLISGSRPLLLVANAALLALSFLCQSQAMLRWASLLLLAQILYIGMGIVLNGFSPQKMMRLFMAPFYLAWLCTVSLLGAAGFRKDQWVRTTRS
ncbi:MAG: hypothetical protein A2075_18985 [Geobacteraceae bacterium GWC2_58_44]|nr:MAG: hypothetical protein A2075_18985 [Geobacteraceae bacterium GWC2_58_44]HBG07894.1 glycosyltransferase [Geobacter sp.]